MPIFSNPIIQRTVHASRWPSPKEIPALLGILCITSFTVHFWLLKQVPVQLDRLRATLLLIAWLMPLVTMAICASSTAYRMREQSFKMIKQSTLSDAQVVWGYGLSMLYHMRLVLVIIFVSLPMLGDDTLLGGIALGVFLMGLHLLGALLGTVLILRWGHERLGIVLIALGCMVVLALFRMWGITSPDALSPVCLSSLMYNLSPAHYRLSVFLLKRGLTGKLSMLGVVVLPFLLGLAAGWIGWRETDRRCFPRLEVSVGLLALLLLLRLDAIWVAGGERQALVALYEATNGEKWKHNDLWLSDQPICDWEGVRCSCSHVGNIDLRLNELEGKIPSEIGQLTNLTYLDLYSNRLTELPPEIGQLTNLTRLDLCGNDLTELPPEIGQLTSLTRLKLNYNELTELPSEIGQLTNLTSLELRENELIELPPEIGQLTRITHLDLYRNQLTELPPEIGQLARLADLNLYWNQLTELPPEVGQLTNLTRLDLHGNQLTELPPEIGQLTNLADLDLYENQLTELPPEVGQLTNLTSLYLCGNQLTELPGELCLLPDLTLVEQERAGAEWCEHLSDPTRDLTYYCGDGGVYQWQPGDTYSDLLADPTLQSCSFQELWGIYRKALDQAGPHDDARIFIGGDQWALIATEHTSCTYSITSGTRTPYGDFEVVNRAGEHWPELAHGWVDSVTWLGPDNGWLVRATTSFPKLPDTNLLYHIRQQDEEWASDILARTQSSTPRPVPWFTLGPSPNQIAVVIDNQPYYDGDEMSCSIETEELGIIGARAVPGLTVKTYEMVDGRYVLVGEAVGMVSFWNADSIKLGRAWCDTRSSDWQSVDGDGNPVDFDWLMDLWQSQCDKPPKMTFDQCDQTGQPEGQDDVE